MMNIAADSARWATAYKIIGIASTGLLSVKAGEHERVAAATPKIWGSNRDVGAV